MFRFSSSEDAQGLHVATTGSSNFQEVFFLIDVYGSSCLTFSYLKVSWSIREYR